MIAVLGGALTLVIVELLVSSPATAGRIGNLSTILSHAVARFVDPTVPMIGSSSATGSASSSPASPATPASPAAPTAAPAAPAAPEAASY